MQASEIRVAAEHPPHPWRILFVITSSDVGGTESFLRDLVTRLDPRDFDPVVCSLRPCGRIAEEIAASRISVFTLQMSEQPRAGEIVAGVLKLARRLDELRVDLVQSLLYRANTLAGLAARLTRRRPVVVAGQRSLYPLGGRRAALATRLTRRLCDRVVAVSAAVRDELLQSERIEPNRVVVIENGVDTTRYGLVDTASTRMHLGFGPDALVVGAVGRLSPEKGFHHMLEGAALARAQGLPLAIVLAGDGPQRAHLERRASALGLDAHAMFLGVRADPRPVYAALDIFVLPSLEEGSPNSLLEAMSCGRAVVATKVGGVPEIVEHERSGLLIEAGSAPALAAALVRLGRDPQLRHQLGCEAARRVREHFAVSSMVEKHADLYRGLLLGRNASR